MKTDELTESARTGLEIAVIGMAGRFPGAQQIAGFWENLIKGKESLSFSTVEELKAAGLSPELTDNPNFVKAKGGILEGKDYFDAGFFDYTPREAELMSPQTRVFHECVWEALEDAGYDPGRYEEGIGLYAGSSSSFSWEGLCLLTGKSEAHGDFAAGSLADKDFMPTRISYKLDLRGPVVSLQTACSTSLVAIHMACRGLLLGECKMALAGGVTVSHQDRVGYLYQEGMILSPDGRCRPFEARAKGTVAGNGAGAVMLKTLNDALADRDHIYALVKGSAVNNDGLRKVGYEAPGLQGQADVIRAALRFSRVEAESIVYVETHGTGTILGDPLEIEALEKAFNTSKKGFCALGALKANVGHLDAAAGVAAFIKTVLVLKHKILPPPANFTVPNPRIDFDNSPFYIDTRLRALKGGTLPLRAGVSSFGIGGTNAHAILEEAPQRPRELAPLPSAGLPAKYRLILLSAKTPAVLENMRKNLAGYFKTKASTPGQGENPVLADAAYTLQVGRRAFQHREMLVCAGVAEALEALATPNSPALQTFAAPLENPRLVFMFPGQGAQYENMALELYRAEPLFREEMDRCFKLLLPLMGFDLKEILYPPDRSDSSDNLAINRTEIAQPLLFTVEYALATLLQQWGIKPYAMIGHSIGEYTAACLAGVFSLEEALTLVVARGKLMRQMPPGAMLSTALPAGELQPLLGATLQLAAVNSSSLCTAAGPPEAVAALEKRLKEKDIKCTRLHTSHAFHSAMMDPVVERFAEEVNKIPLKEPAVPYISNVTGEWIRVEDARNPRYWARHLRETVCFARGVETLFQEEKAVFLEVGPGKALSTFVHQHRLKPPQPFIIDTIRHAQEKIADTAYLLSKIGELWLYGGEIDWNALQGGEARYRLPLPTYPFERHNFRFREDIGGVDTGKRLTGGRLQKKPKVADWFYIPVWKRSPLPGTTPSPTSPGFLVLADSSGVAERLAERLEARHQDVILVKIGTKFEKLKGNRYTINPAEAADYQRLLESVYGEGSEANPGTVVHMGSVTGRTERGAGESGPGEMALKKWLTLGYYSLVLLVQALVRQGSGKERRLLVVSSDGQEVTGDEVLHPGKATVLAPVKVIPQEHPQIRCRSIDIRPPLPGTWQEERLIRQLADELLSGDDEGGHRTDADALPAAYRGKYRYVQTFAAVRLEKPDPKDVPLRHRGVYLITGGLGEVGLLLAQHLAKTRQARLVLVGRSPFPPPSQWDLWLTQGSSLHKTTTQFLAQHGLTGQPSAFPLHDQIDLFQAMEKKIEQEQGIKSLSHYPGFESLARELCAAYIYEYFKRCGLDTGKGQSHTLESIRDRLELQPKFEKFFDFFMKVLEEEGIISTVVEAGTTPRPGSRIRFIKDRDEVRAATAVAAEALERFPGFKGIYRQLSHCAAHYPEALSGKIPAIGVIYPEGRQDFLAETERETVEYSNIGSCNLLLKEILSLVLNKTGSGRKLRILEIGAGNGQLTRILVPVLTGWEVEYYLTDIGRGFVENARKEAQKNNLPFMKFGILDISKDPLEQGFASSSFDMIVGLNVVHATRDIRSSLGHLHRLLAPGGDLALVENTLAHPWVHMVWGLAEGWWYFEDTDLRRGSPLLDLETWEQVLIDMGFAPVVTFPQEKSKRLELDGGLIVAQQPLASGSADSPGKVPTLQQEKVRQIREKLIQLKQIRTLGGEVMTFSADAGDLRQMEEVVTRAEKAFGSINGIIHAAGTTRPAPLAALTPGSGLDELPFRAKIDGALVLEKIFRDRALDFCLLMSSIASVLGGLGNTAYTAANMFMDLLAQRNNQLHPGRWLSVNWGAWPGWAKPDRGSSVGAFLAQLAMTPEESVDAFERVLAWREGNQLVHSAGDLQVRIKQWVQPDSREPRETRESGAGKHMSSGLTKPRPGLTTAYVPPTTPLENNLCQIWQNQLGYESIGIQDDFFRLGGDSLTAVTLTAKIHKQLQVEIPTVEFFARPTIEKLAEYIKGSQKSRHFTIEPTEAREYYRLSSAQKRLFVLQQIQKEGTAYNETQTETLEPGLDWQRLQQVFKRLIQRHEGLRASIRMVGGEPVQRIRKAVEFEIHCYEKAPLEIILSEFIRPFDLGQPPLFRAALIHLGSHRHLLVVDMHHIITDSVSHDIFIKELKVLYGNAGGELPALKLQYKDYAEWQHSVPYQQVLEQQERFWLKIYAGEPPILELPTDFPRSGFPDFKGGYISFPLDQQQHQRLKELEQSKGITRFMLLLALYAIFLAKISGQEDIVLGTLVEGRRHPDLAYIIGMFVNTLVLRYTPRGDMRFGQFLQEVKAQTLQAFDNQDYPFEQLVGKVARKREVGRNPLFDAAFSYLFVDETRSEKSALPLTAGKNKDKAQSKFDLTLHALENHHQVILAFSYSAALFKEETIERFIRYYNEIVSAVAENPDILLKNIKISTGLGKIDSQEILDMNMDFDF